MDKYQVLKKLVKDFTYTTDYDQYGFVDVWNIVRDDTVQGDCEDFALSLLYRLEDNSVLKSLWAILTGKAKFYRYKSNTIGHVVLAYKDGIKYFYADSIVQHWNDGGAIKQYGFTFDKVYSRTMVMLKIGVSKILQALSHVRRKIL